MTMTDRERLLAVLNHQSPDRIPWVPRLNLWYEAHKRAGTLPARYRNSTLREIERDLGMGNPARGGHIHKMRYEGLEVLKRRVGDEDVTEWRTPVGSVFRRRIITPELEAAGLPSRISEYPLKGPADYAVWEYVAEHTYWDPTYEAYHEYDRSIGDEGYPFITAGDVPVHDFLENLTGYEDGFLQMADYPQEIEHLLAVMAQVEKERLWPVVANSPAKLIRYGGHFDSQITAPPLYRKFILPFVQELSKVLHAKGQTLVLHADNDTHLLFKLVEESGYDLAECFTTEPMVRTTLKGAREAWGARVIIWGGIPSVLLTSAVSEDEFEHHMDELFRVIAPGDAFILGVGDNVVPDAIFDRVVRVSEMVRERGTYPVKG